MSEQQLDFFKTEKTEVENRDPFLEQPKIEIKKTKKRKSMVEHFVKEPHDPETCVQCINGDFCSRAEDKVKLNGRSHSKI